MSFKDFLNEKKVKLADTNPADFRPDYLGAAAISLTRDMKYPEFILNGANKDGWFRRTEGNSKGYGLMVRDIKVTSKTSDVDSKSSYNRYKVKIAYLPSEHYAEDPANYETSAGWVWVHKDYTLDEVLAYINKEKSNWVP